MPARFLDIRPGEGRSLLRLGGHLLLGFASVTMLTSVAEALFINAYPAARLPYVYLGGALLGTVGGLAYEALRRRLASRLLGTVVTITLVVLMLAGVEVLRESPRIGPVVLLVIGPLANIIVLIENGEFVGRSLDVRTARRLLPAVGALGNLGSVVGGLLVGVLSSTFSPRVLLGAAAVLFVLQIWPAHVGEIPVMSARRAPPAPWFSLGRFPLATMLLALILVGGAISTIVRFQLADRVQDSVSPSKIASFLGLLNAAISTVLVVFQLLVARWTITRLAVGSSLSLYPGMLFLFCGLSFLIPGLGAVTVIFFIERLLRQSFQRPLVQVAAMPLPDPIRQRASVAFRGTLEMLAITLASAAMIVVPHGRHGGALSIVTMALGAAGIACALAVRGHYVRELTSALHARRLRLRDEEDDAMPLETTARRLLHQEVRSGVAAKTGLALRLLEGRCMPETVEAIKTAWPQWDSWTRIRAVLALSSEPVPDAVEFLRSLGPGEPDPVRAAVLRTGLVEVNDADLEKQLASPTPVLKAEAMILLLRRGRAERIRPLLLEWIGSGEAGLLREAARVIGEAKDEVLAPMLPELADVAPVEVASAVSLRPAPQFTELCIRLLGDDRTFGHARDALAKIGAPARAGLLAAARQPERSAAAIRVLGEIDDPGCRRALLELLTDSDEERRFHAAKALGRHGELLAGEIGIVRAALDAELARCRRHAALRGRGETLVREEANANFEAALERLFVLLSLLHPARPLQRIYYSCISPDPAQRGFALESLDGILDVEWKSRILPLLERHEVDPADDDLPPDQWEVRIHDALTSPGQDQVMDRAILLKTGSLFRGWRIQDLEPVARASLAAVASEARIVVRDSEPVEFEKTILEEISPASPGDVSIPLSEIYAAIRRSPRCGSAWLRGLASRLPRGDATDVTHGPISEPIRRGARDTKISPSSDPWQRLFLLRCVPLFAELAPERLWLVAEIARPTRAAKGEAIVREGSPGYHFYLICSGRAEVTREGKPVAVLGELEAFGEFAMLTGEPRSATVRATEPCDLLRIDRVDFLDLIDTNPSLVKPFSRMIVQRILANP